MRADVRLEAHERIKSINARIEAASRQVQPPVQTKRILAPGELGQRAFDRDGAKARALREEAIRERQLEYMRQYRETFKAARISPRQIIAKVAERNGVAVADILGPCQAAKISLIRFEAIAAVRSIYPERSLTWFGQWFGDRHHTTILNALKRIGTQAQEAFR
jgi:chromosomal replication initiation ATPase DnaA